MSKIKEFQEANKLPFKKVLEGSFPIEKTDKVDLDRYFEQIDVTKAKKYLIEARAKAKRKSFEARFGPAVVSYLGILTAIVVAIITFFKVWSLLALLGLIVGVLIGTIVIWTSSNSFSRYATTYLLIAETLEKRIAILESSNEEPVNKEEAILTKLVKSLEELKSYLVSKE